MVNIGGILAPKSYTDASAKDLCDVCNGCGPDGWKGKLIPDTIVGVRITAACNIHDWMYHAGGSDQDRLNADRIFLHNMLTLISRSNRWCVIKAYGRQKAWWYYRGVRRFGCGYFNEKTP